MRPKPILLTVLAVLVVSVLLAGAPSTVAANGDHDHGDGNDDGGLPDWVPDIVGDFVRAIVGLIGVTTPGASAAFGAAIGIPYSPSPD